MIYHYIIQLEADIHCISPGEISIAIIKDKDYPLYHVIISDDLDKFKELLELLDGKNGNQK